MTVGMCRVGCESGFSLVEVLVVLVVVTLSASIVFPQFGRREDPELAAKTAAAAIAAELRLARTAAIRDGRHRTLTVDGLNRTWQITPDRPMQTLPQLLSVQFLAARGGGPGNSTAELQFFPDGTSSGGLITLSSSRFVYLIDIDWLTGASRMRISSR